MSSSVNDRRRVIAGRPDDLEPPGGQVEARVEPDRAVDPGHPRRGAREFRRAGATRGRPPRQSLVELEDAAERPG